MVKFCWKERWNGYVHLSQNLIEILLNRLPFKTLFAGFKQLTRRSTFYQIWAYLFDPIRMIVRLAANERWQDRLWTVKNMFYISAKH